MKFGIIAGILCLIVIIGVPGVLALIAFPKFGIMTLLTGAYLIMFFYRFPINFPLGTLMDGIVLLLLIGFIFSQKSKPDYSVFQSPLSYVIFIWISYNLLEAINPSAASRLSWLYAIRPVALFMVTYFIFTYYINHIKFVRLVIKLWLGLSLFAALFAFKQEYIGFFDYEFATINNPQQISLLFIGGVWRKFSIFSDPVAFSYNMVVSTLLCIGLITGPLKMWKKLLLGGFALMFIWAMLFSGTRGAYVLIPATLILFSILKYNKKVLAGMIVMAIMMVGVIFMPTGNNTLIRFQSAFKPSNDASYNLRKYNQKRIQPFIISHPMGGGLGATEVFGKRFAPNSYLANFPPDSGYIRVAVELGWLGLFIFCCFMFTALKTGIVNYYAIKNPELKSYCLSMVLIVFALNVGNFPQEALVQFPVSIYFYLVLALITITRRLDDKAKVDNEAILTNP
ncbi:O-antigen ligase family protein [Pedobacter sp. MR2016-24]|uniref:O-antigen ligase family protein n=1 Tax=Pedobacter sp. MR2016-24 TaxID=2994466 RepID=UPI002247A270|nr:O-antigen ligase family protein [Pedobacter sp. MR2016-24]MCX2484230.1 O-antigen ligase family protein [Pedobacter sp. MR2016-24]